MTILYRGVTEALPQEGSHFLIREDRMPRYTGKKLEFNICFNLMIEHRFGFPLIRRRVLFALGDIKKASKYAKFSGDPNYIGVVNLIGEYKFIYAPNLVDAALIADDMAKRYLACFEEWQINLCHPLLTDHLLTLEKVNQFFDDHPNIDVNPEGASPLNSSLRERIYNMLDSFFESTTEQIYLYTDENLQTAADLGVEVMIFDCPGGYILTPVDGKILSSILCREQSTNEV